jgi:ARG/rhodanese/phosphatase superfamily protein
VVNHFSDAVVKNPIVGQKSKNPQPREWHTKNLGRLPGLKFMRTLLNDAILPAVDLESLEDALAAGTLAITEVSAEGQVSELRVKNSGENPVLILDGEELSGAKQNRIVNVTIVAPTGRHCNSCQLHRGRTLGGLPIYLWRGRPGSRTRLHYPNRSRALIRHCNSRSCLSTRSFLRRA